MRYCCLALLACYAAAAGAAEGAAVPTLADAIAQSPVIVRVEVKDVPADGSPCPVEVWEVLWGDYEYRGWVDGRYELPAEAEGAAAGEGRFDFFVGRQYIIFGQRGVGGVYKPFLSWNTRWGVADVVGGAEGDVDLSRLAEGGRAIKLTEFRELVKEIKWGM